MRVATPHVVGTRVRCEPRVGSGCDFRPRPDGNSLWDYAVRRGWEDDTQIVNDADVLMRLVRSDRVGVVLCANFDGLGRSVPEVAAVLREFVSRKVVLIIPGRINTSVSPQVFLKTLDAIEEFKHSRPSQRLMRDWPPQRPVGSSLVVRKRLAHTVRPWLD